MMDSSRGVGAGRCWAGAPIWNQAPAVKLAPRPGPPCPALPCPVLTESRTGTGRDPRPICYEYGCSRAKEGRKRPIFKKEVGVVEIVGRDERTGADEKKEKKT